MNEIGKYGSISHVKSEQLFFACAVIWTIKDFNNQKFKGRGYELPILLKVYQSIQAFNKCTEYNLGNLCHSSGSDGVISVTSFQQLIML